MLQTKNRKSLIAKVKISEHQINTNSSDKKNLMKNL